MTKTIVLAVALLLGSQRSGSAATILLTPSNTMPGLGDIFTVDLIVNGNAGEILGFGLNSSVDTSAILLQSFDINPVFGPDALLPGTQVSAITFPGSTDPSVTLVTFKFLAQQLGPSVFSIFSDLSTGNEGLFLLDEDTAPLDGQVTIRVGAVVPEPSTSGVAALLLVCLLAAARRRRLQNLRP